MQLEWVETSKHNYYKHNKGFYKCNYNNLRYQNWDLRFKHQKDHGGKSYDELFMKHRSDMIKFEKFSKKYYFASFRIY